MKLLFCFPLLLLCGLAQAQWTHSDGLLAVNGTKLYVKITGSHSSKPGHEPVIVVHGGPGLNQSYIQPHLRRLSKDHPVIFFDQRASGRSSTPRPDSITLAMTAGDIEALRQQLHLDKIVLFAHSWGAIPAIVYATRYPQQVAALIFCNPVPLNRNFDVEQQQRLNKLQTASDSTDRSIVMGSPDFKAGRTEAYRKLMMIGFRHLFADEKNRRLLTLQLPDNYLTSSKALYEGLSPELRSYDYYEQLRHFTFPILILYGEKDAIPEAAARKMLEAAPNSRLTLFRHSGHFIFIEEPKRFTNEVERFIGTLR